MKSNKIIPTVQQNMDIRTSLLDLNDDCLLRIIRMLSLADLARVSDACKKFQYLAADAFKYEWKNKTVKLSNNDKDNKLESSAILRNFGNQLQKVHIVFDKHANDKFFKLFIDKCSSQLTQVNFSSTCFNVELERFLSKKNIRRLNTKFGNLKTLRFGNNTDDITEPECIEQYFPALEELSLSGYPFENRNVRQFVKFNPQIKSLSLFHYNNVHDAANMIGMINHQLPQLDELGLWIHGQADYIEFQPRFLNNLRRLKIHNYGRTTNLQHLSISSKQLKEMELELGSCDENLIDFICHYKELNTLAIRMYSDSPFDCKFLPKLKEHLPKLTSIEITGFWRDLNHMDIVLFVQGSKLVNFILRDVQHKNILEDMDKIQKTLDSTQWTVGYNASPRQLQLVRAYRPGSK